MSYGVWCASDSIKELIVTDDTVLVGVQVLEQDLGLSLSQIGAHVLHSPVELLLVNLSVSIIIENTESSSHTSDCLDATGVQTCLNLLEN